MKLKIFKSALYTLIMVLSIYSYANSQGISPTKEKELEDKMQKLELKLKDMQVKLDSMKVKRKKANITNGNVTDLAYAQKEVQKALTEIQRGKFKVISPEDVEAINESINKAFKGLNKTINSNFNYNSNFDLNGINLAEKVKSGEAKEKIKNYTKSYSVTPGDKLQVDNSFGKITVTTWNKNEFKVNVEIKADANDDDDAQKLLDGVNITDNKDGNIVSFTTNITNESNPWSIKNPKGKIHTSVHNVEVNYNIYMPSKNALDLKNRFGSIVLSNFDGQLTINNTNGNFTAKDLTNTRNMINTRFCDVSIASINGGALNCEYGNGGPGIKIGTVNNLTLNARFLTTNIDKVKTAAKINISYGEDGLIINELDKNLKSLNINAAISAVAIGLKNLNNFDFAVSVKLSDFKYDNDRVKITSKSPDNDRGFTSTKTYTGYVGKSNSNTKITINNTYKGVEFL